MHSAPITHFVGPIYSYPGVTITPNNVFFGLNYFWSNSQKLGLQLYLANSKDVMLLKEATVSYLSVHILVFLRNHCPDPYTYDET